MQLLVIMFCCLHHVGSYISLFWCSVVTLFFVTEKLSLLSSWQHKCQKIKTCTISWHQFQCSKCYVDSMIWMFFFWTVHIDDLYCFHYTCSTEDIPKPAGWNFFDLQSEYQRMRVPSDQWSLNLLNKDYEVCIT